MASPRAPLLRESSSSGDIGRIASFGDFWREYAAESKKLWYLAAPAVFTSVCQYSLGFVTQTIVGQVGTLELAAFTYENTVIGGLTYGIMIGMGSALETLCGQAYGAGKLDMLGVYMQRSWVILSSTSLLLTLFYIFSGSILKLIGQPANVAAATGKLCIWMIPQIFAYAMNFPISKFLQAQSKMMAMAVISAAGLGLHAFFSWLLILKLNWGLAGAAVVLNASWWFIVVAQLVYIFGGACESAWTGFSWLAFHSLWSFLQLSLASAVMLCLESWYFSALVVFAGYLKNAELAVDGLSICMNILGWTVMVAFGYNAATSVRVSNELGARHPRAAKFSILVVVIASTVVAVLISLVLLVTKDKYPSLFTNNEAVKEIAHSLTPLLVGSIVVNNIQPVLSGVAVGAGWQTPVAYLNICCYYLFGIPIGLVLGYKFDLGVKGIWYGMLSGTVLQTLILFWMTYRTDWNKESSLAEGRLKQWGGEPGDGGTEVEK